MAKRSLLMLIRMFGVVALVFLVYAWRHPDTLRAWTGRHDVALAAAVSRLDKPADKPAARGADKANDKANDKPAEPSRRAEAPPPDKPAVMPAAVVAPAPAKVTSAQAAEARWIGAKYGVAPDAIAPLVAEADKLTGTYKLSPNLLIAVMAIESNFHPYIQSEAGAQGLMQVMPKIHSKRYEKFGGKTAFMDPLVSLRVGAEVLRDSIKLKDGSEAEGLRFYFGGGPASDTYIDKVRAEQARLNLVARGAHVPTKD